MSTADLVLEALQRFQLKREGSNRYRCNSPLRPDSDSMGFTLVIDGPENGAYKDFPADESGSLYDLAQQLGIALPAAVPVKNTKRKYTDLADYATAHGLPVHVLEYWHWRETMHKGRKALVFPTATGERWRFLDGGKPPYISPHGYQVCWYGMSQHLLHLAQRKKLLVICNGEISTIAGQHYNLPAVALTGGEKSAIPTALLDELKGKIGEIEQLTILVALDCDKAGMRAGQGIAAQLKDAGFDARAVDLGLGRGGDLADFCMLHTDDAETKLPTLPDLPPIIDTEGRAWRPASLAEVLKLAPIEWLVPRVIPSRGLTMVFGASGSFKSFWALDLAMNLGKTHNIMYVAAEGEHGYRQRSEAWLKHHGVKKLPDVTFILGQVDMFDDDDMTAFARVAEAYRPRMIVVDTFAMCSGAADENNARDMMKIVRGCKALAQELNCAVVVVHHTNQEGKKERGSKVLRNACDTIIRISKGDDVIVVDSQKTKDTAPFDTYYLKEIVIALGYKNNLGEEITSLVLLPSEKVIRPEEVTEHQRKVLEMLAVQPDASPSEIADNAEMLPNTVYSILRRLEKRGFIERSANKRNLTEKGQAVVDGVDAQNAQSAKNDAAETEKVLHNPSTLHNSQLVNDQQKQPSLIPLDNPKPKNHYDGGL